MTDILNSAEPLVGEIILFAGNFAPRGWAICDGRLLNPSDYPTLFSIMGTFYGGDGRTTFALPDLRGRVPIGNGTGAGLTARVVGQQGGGENVTLTVDQLPAHHHAMQATSTTGNLTSPNGNVLAPSASNDQQFHAVGGATLINLGVNSGESGGGAMIPNLQPFLVLNFIIALQGRDPRTDDARIIKTLNP